MHVLKGLLAAAAMTAMAGTAAAEGELNIFNWGNYTNPKLIEKFEKETGIDVNLDGYDSNETMLAKVRAGGSGYDIVVPTDYYVKIMIDEGLLEKTEPNKMSNFKNVEKEWQDPYYDPKRNYSVPWQWGTTAFSVNTADYDGDINTYAILFEPPKEVQGKINMQPSADEVFGAAMRYMGKPLCSSDPETLKAMYEMVSKAKEHWRTMEYGSIEALTSGNVSVSQNWNGASMRARQQVPTIKFAYPKEGYSVWMDNVVVLKDAPNVEAAKKFQNFIMNPENAALISDFAKYANGIEGSLKYLPDDFASAPEIDIPDFAKGKGSFTPLCDKETLAKYNQLWTNLLK